MTFPHAGPSEASLPTPAVQPVRSASIVAVLTRPETARARSLSDVMKASACSCVSATNSASNVVSHPKLMRDLPRRPLEHLVAEEANLQRVDPRHPLDPLCGRDLIPAGGLVERGQRLRANERRCDELVFGGDLDLAAGNPKQRLAVDDEAGHAADAIRARAG